MTDFAQRRTMMVDTQVRPNDVTSYPVIDAMLNTPREAYLPDALHDVAYAENDLDLGHGRHMLAPRTLGRMLEALALKNTDLVLDLGCGYGYTSALIARVAEAVVAVDDTPDMADQAQTRLAAQGVFNVAVTQAPLTGGWPGQAPYDAMLVNGAIEVFPDALADQLREGGRVVALFREDRLGICKIGYKADGVIGWRYVCNASAPLLAGFGQVRSFAL